MEPNYVGANGRINAMAAVWMLDNDHVFFLDSEITWDGVHHGFTGAQINSATIDEIPILMSNCQTLLNGLLDLMLTLEADEELRVKREKVHPALYSAIREGDLTGITLFNLIACGHAIKIAQNDDGSYVVFHDNRLARGIPAFYKLVSRMIADMREYNGIDGSFQVQYASARNIDADQYLGSFEGMVPDAVSEAMWLESVGDGQPAIEVSNETEQGLNEEGISELFAGLADALRDLSDAIAEDFGITSEELLSEESAPIDQTWTFDQRKTVRGRRLSFTIPDQFDAAEDDDARTLAVLTFDGVEDDELNTETAEIVYSALLGDSDSETVETYVSSVLPESKMQLVRNSQYGNQIAAAIGSFVDDWIVEGKNCTVLVCELLKKSFMPGVFPDNYEYYVKPITFDHEDMLRITDNGGKLSHDAFKNLALELAKTVEIDKPIELKRLSQLKSYLTDKADLEEFTELLNVVANNLVIARNNRLNADVWLAMNRAGDDKSGVVAEVPRLRATAFAKALEEEIPYYEQFIGVLEAQKRLGNPDFEEMWRLVGEIFDILITDKIEIEDDEEGTRAVNATGIIKIPKGYAELHDRWCSMGEEVLKRQEAAAAAAKAAEEEAKRAEEAAAREKEKTREAFDKLARDIKGKKELLESSRVVRKTLVEEDADTAKREVLKLEERLGKLGLFARAEKKQVNAELEVARRRLADLEAQVPESKAQAKRQRDETVARIEAEIQQLETEAEPYFAILEQDIAKKFESLDVGDTVEFGSYPQDSANAKPTPITWRVCKKSQGTLTLMSEYILDVRAFSDRPKRTNVYEDSSLRSWLEGSFFNEAFDLLEQRFMTSSPYVCTEKELKDLFSSEFSRAAGPTAYAKSKGGDQFYWVATSKFEGEAYCVNGPGMILGDHTMAFASGMSFMRVGNDVNEKLGVRPAIRVKAK